MVSYSLSVFIVSVQSVVCRSGSVGGFRFDFGLGLHVEVRHNLSGCQVDGDGVVEVGAVAFGQRFWRLVVFVDMLRLVVDGDNKVRRALWSDSAGGANIVRFDLEVVPFALAADSGIDGDNEGGIHNHHKAEEILADGLEPAFVGVEEYSEKEANATRKRYIREPRQGDDVLPRRENHRHQYHQ